MKRIRISSSIGNFYERLRERYADYGDFRWFSSAPTIFFGMYHWLDYMRVTLRGGTPTIFWCGSDILALTPFRSWLLQDCRHVCENIVEFHELIKHRIYAKIHPMLFADVEKYQVTYKRSDTPTVWMSYHLGREEEYGLYRFLNVAREVPELHFRFFNGQTPIEDFDEVTAEYQATIRFNEFDGASENITKAFLRGQYVYSVIPYTGAYQIDNDADLIRELRTLKDKLVPNPETEFWRELLSNRVEI